MPKNRKKTATAMYGPNWKRRSINQFEYSSFELDEDVSGQFRAPYTQCLSTHECVCRRSRVAGMSGGRGWRQRRRQRQSRCRRCCAVIGRGMSSKSRGGLSGCRCSAPAETLLHAPLLPQAARTQPLACSNVLRCWHRYRSEHRLRQTCRSGLRSAGVQRLSLPAATATALSMSAGVSLHSSHSQRRRATQPPSHHAPRQPWRRRARGGARQQ